MLEKMGLPAKPSLRGNNWVVDASHCQSCSSQFTFLNRKHHCRRCGGIFCGTCTQNRMVLRGQGDSPVRICEPCKKLEEAARFELRYGHKNRAGKGSSKPASRSVDEVLNQIMTHDGKASSKDDSSVDEDASLVGTASNDMSGADNSEMDSFTPEELRQQALEERKQHKILKGEGKSADALKAFKKAKELERQAAALELQLRKNRRKALASSSTTEAPKEEEAPPEMLTRDKSVPKKGKEKKDDLTAELRQLGWSDADIHDVDKKPATTSLEGELLNLIGRNSEKASHSKESSGLDKSQVTALKKNALALKREGKLAEAKEELKRAKILERQIEEQELLGEADESDDELSALMRTLDNDDRKGLSTGFDLDVGFDMNSLSEFGGDLGIGGNFEVTDDDLHDPEMAATLHSLGWDEDFIQLGDDDSESTSVNREALEEDILKLKREAVSQKRSGNMAEAMSLLKKAKNLEKDLETLDDANTAVPESNDLRKAHTDSESGEPSAVSKTSGKPAPKSRLTIQKELLALKKKALALRREGKLEEADNELKKGKVLEQQLDEMDNAANVRSQTSVGSKASEPIGMDLDLSSVLAPVDDDDVDLTDQDVNDPTYLAVLQNLGWQDGDSLMPSEAPTESLDTTSISVTVPKRRRSKAEIQRELLGVKRKALALRRQGQETEAEELLSTAKMLEEELSEIEAPKQGLVVDSSETIVTVPERVESVEKETNQTPLKRSSEAVDASEKRQVVHAAVPVNDASPSVSPDNPKSPIQQEILAHKRKALLLKREGKLAEARDELRKAKLLEKNSQEDKPEIPAGPVTMEITSSVDLTVPEQKGPPQSTTKPMSSNDRLKLQRECLNHKRNALKLRREGKTDEADAELELAKKLESQLEEASPQNPAPATSAGGSADMAGIEDLFDSQLLSALQAIGLQNAPVVSNAMVKEVSSSTSNDTKNNVSSQERAQLEAQIKAEKMKALNLKRAGKQAEALDVLRRAKQMEKKLGTLPL